MIKRPNLDEYSPFAAGYVGLVSNEDVTTLLEQSMNRSYALFSNLTETQAAYTYAPGKWTVKEAVGHMIDTERTFAYRAMVFSRNNIELPGFDQDVYVANADFNSRDIKELAAEFKTLRQSNLYMIEGFTPAQLLREGIASNARFTVRAFIYMLAGHELHHYNIFKDRYNIG